MDERFDTPEKLYDGLLLHYGNRLFDVQDDETSRSGSLSWLFAGAACGQGDEEDDPPVKGLPFDPRLNQQDHVLPMVACCLEGKGAVRKGRRDSAVETFQRGVLHAVVLAYPSRPLDEGVEKVLLGQQRRFELNQEVKPPWTERTSQFLFDRIIAHLVQLTTLVGPDRRESGKRAELAADASNYVLFYLHRVNLLEPLTHDELEERLEPFPGGLRSPEPQGPPD